MYNNGEMMLNKLEYRKLFPDIDADLFDFYFNLFNDTFHNQVETMNKTYLKSFSILNNCAHLDPSEAVKELHKRFRVMKKHE